VAGPAQCSVKSSEVPKRCVFKRRCWYHTKRRTIAYNDALHLHHLADNDVYMITFARATGSLEDIFLV